ncbi:hypothetical protein Syn7803C97_9 [Synechococcus phage S-MbCM6]|uniref:Uncharacterized protein n=1 Tax=Synechococcus phage S-MbCM6 TaxID=3126011 RepID=A0A0E3F6D8_9CAUD|nr:hypothetical protein Syn7803C97_9 [Synechococcus phage ACG-2014c]
MAKIQAYKFVNPGVSNSASPKVRAAVKHTLAVNRIGSTVEGIANVTNDLLQINKSTLAFQKRVERTKKINLRRERDEKAENRQESASLKLKSQQKLRAEKDKKKLKLDKPKDNPFLDWAEKTFAPLKDFFIAIVAVSIIKKYNDIRNDPEQLKEFDDFWFKTKFVFGKIYDFANGTFKSVMEGWEKIFGDENTFQERLEGLGTLVKGIGGLLAIGFFLNPMLLVNTVLTGIDFLLNDGGNDDLPVDDPRNKPKKPKKPKKPTKPGAKPPTGKPSPLSPFQLEQARKGADAVPPTTKPNLFQRLWNRTADGSKNLFRRGKDSLASMGNWWSKNSKAFIDGAKGIGKGVYNWGANQAKSIKNLADLARDPAKLKDVVGKKLKDNLKPIIEKDEGIKKIFDIAKNPKAMGPKLIDTFKNIVKSPATRKGVNFLKEARKNVKIGGIDSVIAAIFALLDYGVFGESPINAIVSALGSLLGYSAGFAIGAPFGGVPGFITGAVGGIAGEFVAAKVLEGLAKTFPQLTEIDDPVARQLFPNAPRSILRDPNSPMELTPDQQKALDENLPELPKKASGGKVAFYSGHADMKTDGSAGTAYGTSGGGIKGNLSTAPQQSYAKGYQSNEAYFNDKIAQKAAQKSGGIGVYRKPVRVGPGSSPQSNYSRIDKDNAAGITTVEIHMDAPKPMGMRGMMGTNPDMRTRGKNNGFLKALNSAYGVHRTQKGLGSVNRNNLSALLEVAPLGWNVLKNNTSFIESESSKIANAIKAGAKGKVPKVTGDSNAGDASNSSDYTGDDSSSAGDTSSADSFTAPPPPPPPTNPMTALQNLQQGLFDTFKVEAKEEATSQLDPIDMFKMAADGKIKGFSSSSALGKYDFSAAYTMENDAASMIPFPVAIQMPVPIMMKNAINISGDEVVSVRKSPFVDK